MAFPWKSVVEEATVLSVLAFPSQSIEFRLSQRFPRGAQVQGATQAGEGFLTRRPVMGFLVGIEAVHSGYHNFLAIDKVPVAYQLIQLHHGMLWQHEGNVVRLRCDRHRRGLRLRYLPQPNRTHMQSVVFYQRNVKIGKNHDILTMGRSPWLAFLLWNRLTVPVRESVVLIQALVTKAKV
jgi:hypothetical protein